MSDWRNICKDRDTRPKVQAYKNWEELPPIPISFPANAMATGNWRSLRPILNKEKCTFIDLFAGMGGIRIGFEDACKDMNINVKCVFSSEIKPYAIDPFYPPGVY